MLSGRASVGALQTHRNSYPQQLISLQRRCAAANSQAFDKFPVDPVELEARFSRFNSIVETQKTTFSQQISSISKEASDRIHEETSQRQLGFKQVELDLAKERSQREIALEKERSARELALKHADAALDKERSARELALKHADAALDKERGERQLALEKERGERQLALEKERGERQLALEKERAVNNLAGTVVVFLYLALLVAVLFSADPNSPLGSLVEAVLVKLMPS
jgi:vacuolar-type H+-ATPase subunit I/STV1